MTTEDHQTETIKTFSNGDSFISDSAFPLFDIVSKKIFLPKVLYLIFFVYLCLQIIFTSVWPVRNGFISSKNQNVFDSWEKLVFIFTKSDYQRNSTSTFLFFAVFHGFVICVITFQIVYFHNTRKLISWTLYPTRFLMEIVPLGLFHLLSNVICHSYDIIVSGSNKVHNTYMILYSVLFIGDAILFKLTGNIVLSSAYLDDHVLCSYNFDPLFYLVISNSLFHFAERVFSTYDEWIDIVLVICHIAFSYYFLLDIINMVFLSTLSTVLLGGTISTAIALDFSRIGSSYFHLDNPIVYPLFIVISFVCSIILIKIILSLKVNRTSKLLAYNGFLNNSSADNKNNIVSNLSEEEKNSRLSLIIDGTSESNIKLLLHIGFSHACDMFLDFSLIKYISQNSNDKNILLMIIRILAYFPTESRLLNSLIHISQKRRDLSQSDRFLLYQIKKIKILRQASSSSNAAIDRLMKMKNQTKQCELEAKSFWRNNITNITDLKSYFKTVSKNEALWEETLSDFPNSISHYEEYVRFLIECSTNFERAVQIKHKISLIESGTNFSVDRCFRSMIRTNPIYLKKKILDLKGNFIMNKASNEESNHSSNGNSWSGSSSGSYDIDIRLQEKIGSDLMTQSRIRMALQSATMGFKTRTSTILFFTNIFTMLIYLGIISFCYFYYQSVFNDRYFATERSSYARSMKTGFSLSTVFNILDWANHSNRVSFENYNTYYDELDAGMPQTFYDHHQDYASSVFYYQKISNDQYNALLTSISELAMKNVNVYELTRVLLEKEVPLIFCHNGSPANDTLVDLKSALSYQYLSQILLVTESNVEDWWTNNSHSCSLFSSFTHLRLFVKKLRESFNSDQLSSSVSYGYEIKLVLYIVPLSCFLLYIIPLIYSTSNYLKELRLVLTLLFSIDNESKILAAKPLMKGIEENDNDNIQHDDLGNTTFTGAGYYFFIILLFLLNVSIMVVILFLSLQINTQFYTTSQWSFMASIRSSFITDCVVHLFQGIFLQDPAISLSHFLSVNESINQVQILITEIQLMKETLLMGSGNIPPLIGVDAELDRLAIKEQCKPPTIGANLHDMYKCSSSNQLLSILRDMMIEIESHLSDYNGTLNDFSLSNFFHLTMNHLLPMLSEMDSRIDQLMVQYVNVFDRNLLILYLLGIGFSFFAFWIIITFNQTFDDAHSASMVLLRHSPPSGIIGNTELVDYLLSRKSEMKKEDVSISGSIVQGSTSGILSVNISGTIEFMNPAITHILGLTPEQLLGQSVHSLFESKDGKEILNQISLMNNGQSSTSFEAHMKCINDNEALIDCGVSIHAISSKSKSNLESFLFIIRDESELSKKQKEAEEAKKQSEHLLLQILPRDIIVRLNQGEKDITFVVPSSTIMFIDIVKFGEYSSHLTPDEILGNLSIVFSAFDELIAKYPLITKIKLIGDIYMAAGGLFNPNEPPTSHAEQMIRFGLDALSQLEDINVKLNSNLCVRIGVNTGGPLIAGVLGTDKPVFDIIGDPINIASRLQSTCVPGQIQISQETYDLVSSLDFQVEKRGEVFLKGKGKSMTYLIHQNNFILNMSSMTTFTEGQAN